MTVYNFKTILQKCELLLTSVDLARLIKYYQRVGQTINYREFLADISNTTQVNPVKQANPGIQTLIEELTQYMR